MLALHLEGGGQRNNFSSESILATILTRATVNIINHLNYARKRAGGLSSLARRTYLEVGSSGNSSSLSVRGSPTPSKKALIIEITKRVFLSRSPFAKMRSACPALMDFGYCLEYCSNFAPILGPSRPDDEVRLMEWRITLGIRVLLFHFSWK